MMFSWFRNRFDTLHELIILSTTNILKRLDAMSVDAQKAQADLDALTATVNTVIPSTIKLINDLAALVAAGGSLPANVEADVTAMKAQLTSMQTTLTATPDPTPAPAPAPTSTP